jgi:hypothetical protein
MEYHLHHVSCAEFCHFFLQALLVDVQLEFYIFRFNFEASMSRFNIEFYIFSLAIFLNYLWIKAFWLAVHFSEGTHVDSLYMSNFSLQAQLFNHVGNLISSWFKFLKDEFQQL